MFKPRKNCFVLLSKIAFCRLSISAYSYAFLRSAICQLSVVCHIGAACLNRSTDLHAI